MQATRTVTALTDVQVEITQDSGKKVIPLERIVTVVAEADTNQPAMATVVLHDHDDKDPSYSETIKVGGSIEIKMASALGTKPPTIFSGELIGIEPVFAVGAPATVTLLAFNELHRLTRGKKSKSFSATTDKDIVQHIAGQYGLTAHFDKPEPRWVKHDHVYQHNQTDLEFLNERRMRLGCVLYVEDKNLYFRHHSDQELPDELRMGNTADSNLQRFTPHLSTANQVSEVKVRGWSSRDKQAITGSAKAQDSRLGKMNGSQISGQTHKDISYSEVELPFASQAEADQVAQIMLQERLMSFVTGSGTTKGNPNIKPGIIVKIDVGNKRFNGKYYVTSVRHRYAPQNHSFQTDFEFQRDAVG